jgi:hypothetical protein
MISSMNASAHIHIDRSPADVFAYVMQVSNDANWRTGVVEAGFTTESPVTVGSEGFDRVDVNGRTAEARWRVFEWEPGSHARWDLVSGPIAGTGGYICAPDAEGGTEFTLEADVQPKGLYRLLGPVFGLLGRRQNRADVAKLKGILES